MGTIVAVRKAGTITIAADAINLIEEIIHPSLNHTKGCLLRFGDAIIGLNSPYTYQQAFEEVLGSILQSRNIPALDTTHQLRRFFTGINDSLKHHYQLVPAHNAGQPFENSPMNALVVSKSGIFKIDANRAVYEFTKYWAIGSGAAFALGALHGAYDYLESSSELAQAALAAAGAFEANRSREIYQLSIKVSDLKVANFDAKRHEEVAREESKGSESQKVQSLVHRQKKSKKKTEL